jgi:hypothetical protein
MFQVLPPVESLKLIGVEHQEGEKNYFQEIFKSEFDEFPRKERSA